MMSPSVGVAVGVSVGVSVGVPVGVPGAPVGAVVLVEVGTAVCARSTKARIVRALDETKVRDPHGTSFV